LLVPAAGWLAQPGADGTTTMIGAAKSRNGARQENRDARPAPSSTPAMAPMLSPAR
jgi:hypothetical protein